MPVRPGVLARLSGGEAMNSVLLRSIGLVSEEGLLPSALPFLR